jgi:hypothetical protein
MTDTGKTEKTEKTEKTQEDFELDWETVSKNRKTIRDQVKASIFVTGDTVEENK